MSMTVKARAVMKADVIKFTLFCASILFLMSCTESVEFRESVYDDYKIEVLKDADVDTDYVYYYRVSKGGEDVIPKCYISSAPDALLDDKIDFDLIVSQSSKIVAIIERKYPHIILAVHDFDSQESWPGQAVTTNVESTYSLGEKMILSLPPAANGKNYILGYKARSADTD